MLDFCEISVRGSCQALFRKKHSQKTKKDLAISALFCHSLFAMTRYIITKESAISGTRNIGDGPTPAAAWVDAFGPKPWSEFTKRSAKNAWVREVEMDQNEPPRYDHPWH